MAAHRYLPLTGAQIAVIAARADVSAKTVRRFLAGSSTLGSSLRRINAALEAEGWKGLTRGMAPGVASAAA